MKRNILTLLILAIFTLAGFSQENAGTAELITDRPDQTESAVTIPKGLLQFETGYFTEWNKTTLYNIRESAFNTSLLRYGLSNSLELRLGLDYQQVWKKERSMGAIDNIQGFAPINIGAKVALSKQNGLIPEAAVMGMFSFPGIGKEEFQHEMIEYTFLLIASHSLNNTFSTGYNLGFEYSGDDHQFIGIYSTVLGISLSDRMGTFAEVYGSFQQNNPFDLRFDTGLTFLLFPNVQLDISGGFGITKESPDWLLSAGFSWRIPK